jgi:hypothetical protein
VSREVRSRFLFDRFDSHNLQTRAIRSLFRHERLTYDPWLICEVGFDDVLNSVVQRLSPQNCNFLAKVVFHQFLSLAKQIIHLHHASTEFVSVIFRAVIFAHFVNLLLFDVQGRFEVTERNFEFPLLRFAFITKLFTRKRLRSTAFNQASTEFARFGQFCFNFH